MSPREQLRNRYRLQHNAEMLSVLLVLSIQLEVQDNSRGKPEVILSVTKEARLQGIALEPPSNSMEKAIIDATT